MSALTDILLAPDVRPFAVAAAIMLALGGIELLATLVGFSLERTIGKESRSRPTATTASAACSCGSTRDVCRC